MTSPRPGMPGDPTNPHGQTARMRIAVERTLLAFIAAHDFGAKITARLIGEAILDDSECQAMHVLAALDVDAAAILRGADLEAHTSEPAGDAMMVKFAHDASLAQLAADQAARAGGRPTATGDLFLGLLVETAWGQRVPVSVEAYRAALLAAEREA